MSNGVSKEVLFSFTRNIAGGFGFPFSFSFSFSETGTVRTRPGFTHEDEFFFLAFSKRNMIRGTG